MKNDYEIRGDMTAIIINSPKYGRLEALISTNKLDRAKEFPNSWYANWDKIANTFYVVGNLLIGNGKQTLVMFHRWVTNIPRGMVVDHKNHDGLINTDDNLRICTHAENQQNRKGAQMNSKSGIRGVFWNKNAKKWQAHIRLQGKQIYLGRFDDIVDAEQAVIEARLKYMPYSKEVSSA